MPVGEAYRRQAALLVSILPFVAAEKCFALKGGTAINLFVRDLPRISVDLDLTYLPIADRDASRQRLMPPCTGSRLRSPQAFAAQSSTRWRPVAKLASLD